MHQWQEAMTLPFKSSNCAATSVNMEGATFDFRRAILLTTWTNDSIDFHKQAMNTSIFL
jgi:hypothetical protein